VVADLVDLARAMREGARVCVPQLGFHDEAPGSMGPEPVGPSDSAQYFRVPGADANAARDVLDVLARFDMQPVRQAGSDSDMAVLTAPVDEARAARAAGALADVFGRVTRLRVEALAAG
jgi:hypothetical protein